MTITTRNKGFEMKSGIGVPAARMLVIAAALAAASVMLVACSHAPKTPPFVAFAEVSLAGTGNQVAKFTIPREAAAIAVVTYDGPSPFVVRSVDGGSRTLRDLIDTVGAYSGTVLIDAAPDEHTAAFNIDADGSWSITVKPLAAAEEWDAKTMLEASGDHVYRIVPPSELEWVDVTYAGSGRFVSGTYASDLTGIADELGGSTGTGSLLFPDGTYLFEVHGNTARWTLSPAPPSSSPAVAPGTASPAG